jgi:hypothetical protein
MELAYHRNLSESALPRIFVTVFAWADAKIDSKPTIAIPAFGGKR